MSNDRLAELKEEEEVDVTGTGNTGVVPQMKDCRGIGVDREGDVKFEITNPGQPPKLTVRYIPSGGYLQQANITKVFLNYALNTPTVAQVYKVDPATGYGALVSGVRLGR
jgi:hypothetical protein